MSLYNCGGIIMKLYKLLNQISYTLINGYVDLNIDNVSYDSRKLKPNSLFVCLSGNNVDGHSFIDEAVKNGAIAILVEKDIVYSNKAIVIIKVKDTRISLANISNLFYNEPSKEIELIGVTGTNGKTTVTHYIKDVLEYYGKTIGTIGTLGFELTNKKININKTTPTTPEALELRESFREFKYNSVHSIVMEVTSSALAKHRVDFCDFNIGIFTNLSQDHLDEHGTMEAYKKEKMKLFHKCKLGIINIDDDISEEIIKDATCKILTYGIENPADIQATDIIYKNDSVSFKINFKETCNEVNIKIPGKFTVYNVLATIAACYSLDISIEDIMKLLPSINPVPGRVELIKNNLNKNVIVDYAHTPDALEKLLIMAREITSGRIITIFGCGGDRDTTKRGIMGKIAGSLSDYCIITSDNPRTENPKLIVDDIESGVLSTITTYEKIINRKNAIERGLKILKDNDLLIIAGKGHEDYQIIGKRKFHFNDREIVENTLKNFIK
jgi:UDP-N-acetylmuramoyl-L-alanyl-D-glutamate--2,6-diaminopimelate ligase